MNILVVGGYDPAKDSSTEDVKAYGAALGREIIRQGHSLINGCQTEFDAVVAGAAHEELTRRGSAADENRIVSYVLAGAEPGHDFGKIINSRLTSWDPGDSGLFAPEPIQRADVVVIVRGFEGSNRAAHWAEMVKKPVLPVAYFGGAALKLYEHFFDQFDTRYGGRIEKIDFEELNAFGKNWQLRAERVVALAEKVATSKYVKVLMSYTKAEPLATELANLLDSLKLACSSFGYACDVVNESNSPDRILPRILSEIERSAFVIVDLTELKPNVFFELGYAEGLRKPKVVTAKGGTELPFDVKDFAVTFWNPVNLKKLREDLTVRIGEIAKDQGRWAKAQAT
jgi:hypothetical protein